MSTYSNVTPNRNVHFPLPGYTCIVTFVVNRNNALFSYISYRPVFKKYECYLMI